MPGRIEGRAAKGSNDLVAGALGCWRGGAKKRSPPPKSPAPERPRGPLKNTPNTGRGGSGPLFPNFKNPNAEKTDGALEYNESLKTEIDRSLKTLTERQKEVICYFFGIGVDHPMSLEDIGEKFSLTRERVRQIKDKAITKLKASNRCQLLRTYLGT